MNLARRLKLLIILAGVCTACGTAPDEPVTSTESAIGWTGSAVLEGDYSCPDGTAWHIYQPVQQSFTRPLQANGYVPNYYTVTLNAANLPAAQDPRNRVAFSCSSYKVPVSPICGSGGALCSTGTAICSVFYRWANWGTVHDWNYAGYVQVSGLSYRPDYSAKGNYLISVPPAVAWGSGDGVPLNGCTGFAGQIWLSFGA
jgi:hypothetical protein